MSDNYQLGDTSDYQKAKEAKRPKNISSGNKNDRAGSKTAPAEQDLNFLGDNDEANEQHSSYNYYVYYHSIKPRDPRLPKPTYKAAPDLDFIKDGQIKEEDDQNYDFQDASDMNKNNMNSLNAMMSKLNMGQSASHYENNSFDIFNQNSMQEKMPSGKGKGTQMPSQGLPGQFGSMDYFNNPNVNSNLMQIGTLPQNMDLSSLSGMGMGTGMNMSMGSNIPNLNKNFPSMSNWEDEELNSFQDNFNNPKGKQQQRKPNKKGNNNMNNNPFQNQNFMPMGMNYNQPNNFPGNNSNNNNNYFKQGGFDPMMFQNPNIYNTFYGNNMPQGNQPNFGSPNNYNMNPMFSNQKNMNKMGNRDDNNYGGSYMMMNNDPIGSGLGGNMKMNYQQQSQPNMGMNMNYGQGGGNKPKGNYMGKEPRFDNNNQFKRDMIDMPFDEMLDKIVESAKEHSGSRLVQRKYEEASQEDRDRIFDKIKPEILSLSKDVFGNYVIQKILEITPLDDKANIILDSLQYKIYELAFHTYGCRVIQKLISIIDDDHLTQITQELQESFEKCIEDQNGNHVIQKLIERVKPGEHDSILEIVLENLYKLSIHQYGCRVIQKLFNHCTPDQQDQIIGALDLHISELCEDQYGNYVIQFVIENKKGENVPEIYSALNGKVFEMSIHKFASNVIEKALLHGTEDQRSMLINEIISKDELIHDSLLSMVKDKFGNYVVQKMIEYADQETKENIIRRIISSQSLKKRDGFSKHVMNFIERTGISLNTNMLPPMQK